jgi:hypothetical protein
MATQNGNHQQGVPLSHEKMVALDGLMLMADLCRQLLQSRQHLNPSKLLPFPLPLKNNHA